MAIKALSNFSEMVNHRFKRIVFKFCSSLQFTSANLGISELRNLQRFVYFSKETDHSTRIMVIFDLFIYNLRNLHEANLFYIKL